MKTIVRKLLMIKIIKLPLRNSSNQTVLFLTNQFSIKLTKLNDSKYYYCHVMAHGDEEVGMILPPPLN